MNDDLKRFRSLCFLYACGKLIPEEVVWMEKMLASHPELAEELDADLQLVEVTRELLADERKSARPLVKFESIMRAMTPPKTDRPMTWLIWLSNMWNRPMQTGWAASAATLLIATSLFQTYRLDNTRQQGNQDNVYRGGNTSQAIAVPILKVVFADKVSIADLRRTLPALNLSIVKGPDDQGTCLLSVDSGTATQAQAQLKASNLVLDVQIAKDVP